jgi:hypothetical protein
MNYPEPTRDQIAQAFETIRLKLINCLEEPERSAFWLAVKMRDVLSRPHEVIETPYHRCEDYAEECAALRARVAELEAALRAVGDAIKHTLESWK